MKLVKTRKKRDILPKAILYELLAKKERKEIRVGRDVIIIDCYYNIFRMFNEKGYYSPKTTQYFLKRHADEFNLYTGLYKYRLKDLTDFMEFLGSQTKTPKKGFGHLSLVGKDLRRKQEGK